MPAPNPVSSVSDYCGKNGVEATELLVETHENLADGTAIEDCAIISRHMNPQTYSCSTAGAVTPTAGEIEVLTCAIPTVDYGSQLLGWLNINLESLAPHDNNTISIRFRDGSVTGTQIGQAMTVEAAKYDGVGVLDRMWHYTNFYAANAGRTIVVTAEQEAGTGSFNVSGQLTTIEFCQ